MSVPDPTPAEERFIQLLAAYDEALAAGQALDQSAPAGLSPELRQRFERARICLHLLESAWPRGQLPPSPASSNQAGVPIRVDRFQIVRELGRGGFGIVFLALDPAANRQVALKVPKLEAILTPELRQRFLREAQLAGGLDHPNIVPVCEAGETDGLAWVASAYCEGQTLAAWLEQQSEPLAPATAALLVAELADAVQHAHERGVLHRDLKPENILLEPGAGKSGLPFVPRVTDFGLARLLQDAGGLTRRGVVPGTPAYVAPEQAAGQRENVGPATDVYGLGVILYQLLTRQLPFVAPTALQTLALVRLHPPVPPSRRRAGLPPELEAICLKCLNKQPAERFASARELADELRRFAGRG